MVAIKTTVKKKPPVKKTTVKPKAKNINYTQLKVLFYKFSGTLQAFLREQEIAFTKQVELQTKTWVKDRKAFLEKVSSKGEEQAAQSLIDKQAVLLGNLQNAKIAGLQELAERLSKPKQLKVGTIRSIINEIRLELGEATEITKNEGAVTSLKSKALELLEEKKKENAGKNTK